MKRHLRNVPLALCIAGSAFAFWLVPGAYAAQDKIIAVVNNEVITQKDLNDFTNFMVMDMQNAGQIENKEQKIAELKPKLLDKLIEDKLILQEAKKLGVTVDEARIRDRVSQLRKRYGSDAAFQEELAHQGISQSDLEQRMREQFLTYTVIDEKVKKDVLINPREVTDYFQEHGQEFTRKEVRDFDAVFVENEAAAHRIADGVRKGGDLGLLCQKESASVQAISASAGKELRPDVEKVAFGLAVGAVSDPIDIGGKYYVFRLKSVVPARQETLEEAQEAIYALLMDRKIKAAMEKWLGDIKSRSYIKLMG